MYRIEMLYDTHECETCGDDYAEGYKIYKGNKLVIDKSPIAHCYSGQSYNQDGAYKDILYLEGIIVEVKYQEED